MAEAYPDLFGYPWADHANTSLVISVVGTEGEAVASGWLAAGIELQLPKPVTLPAPVVPVSIRTVRHSRSEFDVLSYEISGLVDGSIPGGELIYEIEPDYRANRMIVTIDRMSDELLDALASRYGTETVAIRVAPRPYTSPGRHTDISPFWGGAKLSVPAGFCTSGFPWVSGSTSYMVFAGHCIPNGGSVSTPVRSMGSVTASSRENWTSGTGTVYLTGQSVNRGDLALIHITSGSSGTRIYQGSATSESSAPVKEMWWRSPANGDQYCQDGYSSGSLCGYVATRTAFDHRYTETGEWVRNINEGQKGDPCHGKGDSGGPTYTVRGDGGIAAKGIHSGGGSFFGTCYEYFTDIWQAYFGFPGVLRTE